MIDRLLTNRELDVLIEVFEMESRRIAVDARRTRAHDAHQSLRERERTLDRLIERFRELKAGDLQVGELVR